MNYDWFFVLFSLIIGTSHSGGYSHSCVVYALQKCGYRLIDTAKRYGTEEFLKYAIKVCLIFWFFMNIFIN